MRMNRKDTQLLVENWRKLLKVEPIAGEPTNEIFGLGKSPVLVLLKDNIDNKLEELKSKIEESQTKIKDEKQPKDNNELLKLVLETNIDKIVDGQVLIYLRKCLPDEKTIKKSKKVKKKVFENVFNNIVSGSVKFENVDKIIEKARTLKDIEVNEGNRLGLQSYKNLEAHVINVDKIDNIGNKIANLCNKS